MPTLSIPVDDATNRALEVQAHRLLLGKRQYIRAILAAVAREAGCTTCEPAEWEVASAAAR